MNMTPETAPEIPQEASAPLPPPEVTPRSKPFRIYIPGALGGGEHLTDIRKLMQNTFGKDVFIPSSVTEKHAVKKQEHSVGSHYQELAQTILDKAAGKDLHIVGHSLGGHEAMKLLQKLLQFPPEKLPKEIKMTFIGTPGFTSEKFSGLVQFAQKALELLNQAPIEQHIMYPLPNTYYRQKQPFKMSEEDKKLFTDNDEERTKRRKRFSDEWLPNLIPDQKTRDDLMRKLDTFDARILHAQRMHGSVDKLLKKRAKVLHPFISALLAGKAIDEATHQQFLAEYHELEQYLAPPLQFYKNGLLYLASMTKDMYKGMPTVLGKVIDQANVKEVKLGFDFALLENDMMIPVTQTRTVKNSLDKQHISDAFEGFSLADTFAHFSVGYDPQDILPAIYRRES